MSSTESDSDILSSPPDDYFTFPTSRYSDNTLYDSFDYDNNAHESLFSDVNFLGESESTYEPGTSAGTIRPSMEPKARNRLDSTPNMQTDDDEPVDGGGWNEGRPSHSNGALGAGLGEGYSGNSGRTNGSGNGNFGSNGWRASGGRGDDDGDGNDKRRVNRSTFSTPSDSDTSDDTEDDSADDYANPRAGSAPVASGSSSLSDDDVPLAQRIPTALRAQRTIRRQVREERDQRRKERALRGEQLSARTRQTTLRPAGAGDPLSPQMMTSSQEAALNASRSVTRPRPRTRTLPASEMEPFAPEDLSRRLEAMGMPEVPISRRSASTARRSRDGMERPSSAGRGLREPGSMAYKFLSPSQSPPSEPVRSLRPQRSFHRTDGWKVDDHHAIPMPIDAGQQLNRTATRPRTRDGSTATPRSFPSPTSPDSRRSGEESRKLTKTSLDSRPAHTSIELERSPRPSLQRPPVPPLPPSEVMVNSAQANRGPVTQQRVFVGDMQRFNMVELEPSTNAGDVIDMLEAQGALKGWVGSGGWMVWEIAQDFGMGKLGLFLIHCYALPSL